MINGFMATGFCMKHKQVVKIAKHRPEERTQRHPGRLSTGRHQGHAHSRDRREVSDDSIDSVISDWERAYKAVVKVSSKLAGYEGAAIAKDLVNIDRQWYDEEDWDDGDDGGDLDASPQKSDEPDYSAPVYQ